MKCILINAGGKPEVVEVEGETLSYEKMKELLNVDLVTVVERKVGDKYYDLWVDDEGLLKEGEPRYVSGYLVEPKARETLVGNLLITNHDGEGATTGLSDDEIKEIQKHIIDNDEMRKWQGIDVNEDKKLVYGEFGIVVVKAHSHFLAYTL